jgi:predicted DNA-binding protein YlxM (UPF0122 family)
MKKTHLSVVKTEIKPRVSTKIAKAKYDITKPEFFGVLELLDLNKKSKEADALLTYFFGNSSLSVAGDMCGMTKQGFDYKVKRVVSTLSKFRAALSIVEEYQHLNQNDPN